MCGLVLEPDQGASSVFSELLPYSENQTGMEFDLMRPTKACNSDTYNKANYYTTVSLILQRICARPKR